MPEAKRRDIGSKGKNDDRWSLVETPGPFDPVEDLRAFLDGIPAMGLSPEQEAEVRQEVEDALAFRLANPMPGDPTLGQAAE